jgi:hypothetical protein
VFCFRMPSTIAPTAGNVPRWVDVPVEAKRPAKSIERLF